MLFSRLRMILTKEELERIQVTENDNGLMAVTVDVHGLKCIQAKRFVNNIINIARSAFHLTVIHGYRHGTAIKEMLDTNFDNDHICGKYPDYHNKGVTHMLIGAY